MQGALAVRVNKIQMYLRDIFLHFISYVHIKVQVFISSMQKMTEITYPIPLCRLLFQINFIFTTSY